MDWTEDETMKTTVNDIAATCNMQDFYAETCQSKGGSGRRSQRGNNQGGAKCIAKVHTELLEISGNQEDDMILGGCDDEEKEI